MSDWPLRVRIHFLFNRILKVTGPTYVRAHEHAAKHRQKLEKRALCACFYSMGRFPSSQISEWVDDGRTAICPQGGIDSVLGSAAGFALSAEFLAKMYAHWFERNIKIKLPSQA